MAVPEIEIARLHGNGGGVNSDEDYLFDMPKVCVPAVTYARKREKVSVPLYARPNRRGEAALCLSGLTVDIPAQGRCKVLCLTPNLLFFANVRCKD